MWGQGSVGGYETGGKLVSGGRGSVEGFVTLSKPGSVLRV